MKMVYNAVAFIGLAVAAPALSQSNTELCAQLAQTRAQIAEAEAAGVDASLIATLRQSMNDVEESLTEAEAPVADAASATTASAAAGEAQPAFATKPNTLDGSAACSGFTLSNYKEIALGGGNDVQLKTMCGQAFEYYSMYLRAIKQGYSEADANRTYAAFETTARNATTFYEDTKAN